jgi:SOS-response transcriptional repressor LexA
MVLKISIKKSSDGVREKLQVLNSLMELSAKELEVLIIMVQEFPEDPVTPHSQSFIVNALGLKNPNSIRNYIRKLKVREALVKTQANYKLNPIILKLMDNERLEISFN